MTNHPSYTAFEGDRRIAHGSLASTILAIRAHSDAAHPPGVLVFDDLTGRTIDLNLRGSDPEALKQPEEPPRRRGRPRLGVVAREVTLLPRHWEWLAAQPGGASVALRRLVDEARRQRASRDQQRAAQARAYQFMQTMAGDRPGFEEAARALFAHDRPRLESLIAAWPADIAAHVLHLAFEEPPPEAA